MDRKRATIRTGTVTDLTIQTKDSNRVSVYVDGSFAFGMPVDAATDLGIRKGTRLDVALAERALRADREYRARRRALGLLAHRPRAVGEIRDRLLRAGFEIEVAEGAVDRLVALGYLDDEAFAVSYARTRAETRGYGPRRVLSELRRRGVDDRTARAAVDAVFAERDPTADALEAGRRAWRRGRPGEDPRRRRSRLYGYLARRGFESDVIRRVIDRLEQETA